MLWKGQERKQEQKLRKVKDTKYQLCLDFTIERGSNRLMLSAPHCVEQFRNGKYKLPEDLTLPIVKHINNKCGAHIIYKTKCLFDDANYDEKSEYRDVLAEYIITNNVGVLFDVHGLSSQRNRDIIIGTNYSNNCPEHYWVAEFIQRKLNEELSINVAIDEIFTASNQNTVSCDIHNRTSIPTFQIEINRRLLEENMEEFLCAFANTIDTVKYRL